MGVSVASSASSLIKSKSHPSFLSLASSSFGSKSLVVSEGAPRMYCDDANGNARRKRMGKKDKTVLDCIML